MTAGRPRAPLLAACALLGVLAVPAGGYAGVCADGAWDVVDGPLAIAALAVDAIALAGGVPDVHPTCRAVRWATVERSRGTKVRALFACDSPHRLRLRALIDPGCGRMRGLLGVPFRNVAVRFAATSRDARQCAGIAGTACDAGEACALPPGQCGVMDLAGTCVALPVACPELYRPVCGCDGGTYDNACFLLQAGAQPDHEGECRGETCGGIAGIPCPKGEVCELPPGECQTADLQGRCVPAAEACIAVYDPVCGCDGVTYANDCERQRLGVQKAHDGRCRDATDSAS